MHFLHEWRVFVLDGQVLDIKSYCGDYHYHYDADIVDAMVAAYVSAPSAYCLDIGVAEDGKTYLVEVNDGFCVGHYGLGPVNAMVFHQRRWLEMTRPYFERQERFYLPESLRQAF